MTHKDNRPEETAELRRQAEEIAKEKAAPSTKDIETLSLEETRKILHELRVHQIELEMQNDELRRTQVDLDSERANYFDFYNLAPVGYFTLSEKGLILEANLTAGALLGVARVALIKQPIARFILKEDQDTYYLHRKQLFESGVVQACDLRMVKNDRIAFWVYLASTTARDKDGTGVCRVVLSDITERKRVEETLRVLSSRLLISQEEEQRRIAMELHDQSGQDLIVLKLQIAALQNRLRKDQADLKKECEKILTYTDRIIEDVRRLVHGLNPAQLEALGLCAALKALIRNFSEKTRIPIQYDVDALDQCFLPETQIILYRIFQEALTNIYKHAHAETVRIDVNCQGDTRSIKIKDDGQGFDPYHYRMSAPPR